MELTVCQMTTLGYLVYGFSSGYYVLLLELNLIWKKDNEKEEEQENIWIPWKTKQHVSKLYLPMRFWEMQQKEGVKAWLS